MRGSRRRLFDGGSHAVAGRGTSGESRVRTSRPRPGGGGGSWRHSVSLPSRTTNRTSAAPLQGVCPSRRRKLASELRRSTTTRVTSARHGSEALNRAASAGPRRRISSTCSTTAFGAKKVPARSKSPALTARFHPRITDSGSFSDAPPQPPTAAATAKRTSPGARTVTRPATGPSSGRRSSARPSRPVSGLVPGRSRVSDGTRTHDRLDHNQELYQLSYAHQGARNLATAHFAPAPMPGRSRRGPRGRGVAPRAVRTRG